MIESLRTGLWKNRFAPCLFEKVALPSRHTSYLVGQLLDDMPEGSQLLDIGIGTGIVSAPVAKRLNLRLSGVDISEEMLEMAREKMPDATLKQGTATEIPFPPNTFDAVVSNHVLKYVDASKLETVVNEIDRVAKPKATVIISDLALPNLRPPFVKPEHSLENNILGMWTRRQDFKQAMLDKGFEHTETRYPLLSWLWTFRR